MRQLSFYFWAKLRSTSIIIAFVIFMMNLFCLAQNEVITLTEQQEQSRPKIEIISVDPAQLNAKDLDLKINNRAQSEKNSINKNLEPENFYSTVKTTTPFLPYLLQIGGRSEPAKMIEILNFSSRNPTSINEQSPTNIKPKIIIINPTIRHLPEKIKP